MVPRIHQVVQSERRHVIHERLARAQHGQYLRRRIKLWNGVASCGPGGNGETQCLRTQRARIIRKASQAFYQRLFDKFRCRMLGFADGKSDFLEMCRRVDAFKQLMQSFERVGLQSGKMGIHGNGLGRVKGEL